MTSALHMPERKADEALFPLSWLMSELMQNRIEQAAIGIGLKTNDEPN